MRSNAIAVPQRMCMPSLVGFMQIITNYFKIRNRPKQLILSEFFHTAVGQYVGACPSANLQQCFMMPQKL